MNNEQHPVETPEKHTNKIAHLRRKQLIVLSSAALLLVIGVVIAGILRSFGDTDDAANSSSSTPVDQLAAEQHDAQQLASQSLDIVSDFLEEYEISDSNHNTAVTVMLTDTLRTMEANALPNHQTGEFPNDGNPHTISSQNVTYHIPLKPTFTGSAASAREPGVAVNGVKFEPETAERVVCDSGQEYRVEALQDYLDLGLDFNNAHVQPSGAYHYHGVANTLVEFAAKDGYDLVHIGFALDGHLMLYSQKAAFRPGYKLDPNLRSGTGCTITMQQTKNVEIDGTKPDGTYVSDWIFNEHTGDLDECNGTTINDRYVYFITDTFPYIPRCLNGEFAEPSLNSSGASNPSQSRMQSGPPPR